jgi:alkanesulfonate monooxygenase SsuD/methylene tetrahydromethanopterin reductase-like flavin-dependent oxidoreductase (luciferase family)
MRLGLFMQPIHRLGRDLSETYDEDIEKVVLADELGFDEAWIGEHFTCSTEPITSPLIFMANLISRTRRIKLGTGVVNLPQHHPAMVAGEAALFDHLSKGRLLFGIGPGGLTSDFELFKRTDPMERGKSMLESIDMILKLWSQDPPYELHGKFWEIVVKDSMLPAFGVGTMIKPYQRPHPPIAMSAMSPFPFSGRVAASRGWHLITANFVPAYIVKSHWTVFEQACAEAGRVANGEQWHVARTIVVADSDSEASDYVLDPDGSTYAYYDYLSALMKASNFSKIMKPDPEMSDEALTPEIVIKDMVIAGSPKTVAERILAFREDVGPFGTLVISAMDWKGESRQVERRSMELLAKKVRPVVADAVRERKAA